MLLPNIDSILSALPDTNNHVHNNSSSNSRSWNDTIIIIPDSGASKSCFNNRSVFTNMRLLETPIRLQVANTSAPTLEAREIGSVVLQFDSSHTLTLENVLYVPEVPVNLISVPSLYKQDIKASFERSGATLYNKRNQPIATFPLMNNNLHAYIYQLHTHRHTQNMKQHTSILNITDTDPDTMNMEQKEDEQRDINNTSMRWHERLGHTNHKYIEQAIKAKALEGIHINMRASDTTSTLCEGCVFGKSHRHTFSKHITQPKTEIMQRVVSDIAGPVYLNHEKQIGLDGGLYVLTIIDTYSRYAIGYIIKHKSDAIQLIIEWHKRVTTYTGKPLREFHSDGGGEYTSNELTNYWKSVGVRATTTTKATPQHNAIAERFFHRIFEMARSMLHHGKLSTILWTYAVQHSIYLCNRMINKANQHKTPLELFTNIKPNVKHLRVFGSNAYTNVLKQDKYKMDPNAKKGIYVGYNESKFPVAYLIIDLESRKAIASRDVLFDEGVFTFAHQLTNKKDEIGHYDIFAQLFETYNSIEEKRDEIADDHEESDEMEDEVDDIIPQVRETNVEMEEESKLDTIDEESKDQLHTDVVAPHESDINVEKDIPPPVVSSTTTGRRLLVQPFTNKIDTHNIIPETEKRSRNRGVEKHGFIKQQDTIEHYLPRTRTRNKQVKDAIGYIQDDLNTDSIYYALMTDQSADDLPRTYKEAITCAEATQWNAAMNKEMESLTTNNTWILTDAPADRNIIGGKWVYTKKKKSDGSIERYKARWVAKGYTQEYEVDYNKTFAPVVKPKTLRILLSIASSRDYEIKHMDFETAFLNANIQEELYMQPPDGYETNNKVCKLIKTIYGIKQAPNEWNNTLNSYIISLGFKRCRSDTCLYVKKSRTGREIFLAVFVDDLVPAYAEEDENEWSIMKQQMSQRFKMKDLGDIEWILGMRVVRDRRRRTLRIDQQTYVHTILHRFDMNDCNLSRTPSGTHKLSRHDEPITIEEGKKIDRSEYISMVGSLLYASTSTRPDISYSVGVLSRYMHNPGLQHVVACKRVLRYMKGTTDIGLEYNTSNIKPDEFNIEAYTDADWAGDIDERRSTTGWIIKLNGCTVSWSSKRQTTPALSTAEAEYMAVSAVVQEIQWMRQ